MKKLAALLTAGWLAAAGAPSQAAEEIRIGWVYAMANAPVLIADSNGYFAEEGLEAKLLSFTSGPLLKQAMVAGEDRPCLHRIAAGLSLVLAGARIEDPRQGELRPGGGGEPQGIRRRFAGRSEGPQDGRSPQGLGDGRAAARLRLRRGGRARPRQGRADHLHAVGQHGSVAGIEGGGRGVHVGAVHLAVPAAGEHAGDLRHQRGAAEVPLVHHLRDARRDGRAPGRDRRRATRPQEGGRLPEFQRGSRERRHRRGVQARRRDRAGRHRVPPPPRSCARPVPASAGSGA